MPARGQAPVKGVPVPSLQEVAEQDVDDQLEALVAGLDLPSLDEVLSWFEPYPTIDELLAPLPDDPNAPYRHKLWESGRDVYDALVDRRRGLQAALDHAAAIPLIERELAILREILGENHYEVTEKRRHLEKTRVLTKLPIETQREVRRVFKIHDEIDELLAEGRYSETVELGKEQLCAIWRILGPHCYDARTMTSNLAYFLERAGRLSEADRISRVGFALHTDAIKRRHPGPAYNIATYAVVLGKMGHTDAALKLSCITLDLRRRAFGEQHDLVAAAMMNVGTYLTEQFNYDTAESMMQRALAVYAQIHGEQDPRTARCIGNLAVLAKRRGELRRAEQLHREALALKRSAYGNDHPDVGHELGNIASLQSTAGDIVGAIETGRKSLDIIRATLGKAHNFYVYSLTNLATDLLKNGDTDDAQAVFEEAHQLALVTLGANHPLTLSIERELAYCALDREDFDIAERRFRELLPRCRGAAQRQGEFVLAAVHLARTLTRGDSPTSTRLKEAEALLKEACRAARILGDPYHRIALLNQAEFLMARWGRASDALALFIEAIDEVEMLRLHAPGDEMDRAGYTATLDTSRIYGGAARAVLAGDRDSRGIDDQSAGRAFGFVERGRGRALLDLFDRVGVIERAGTGAELNDATAESRLAFLTQRQRHAEIVVESCRKQGEGLRVDRGIPDEQRDKALAQLKAMRTKAISDGREVARELYGLTLQRFASDGLRPLTADEIAAHLRSGELLLTYDVGSDDAMLMLVHPSGTLKALKLEWADHTPITRKALSDAIAACLPDATSHLTDKVVNGVRAKDRNLLVLADALVPAEVRDAVALARRVFIIPDGPLHGLPFEMLTWSGTANKRWIDSGPALVYGPSATVIATKRARAQQHKKAESTEPRLALLAIGDPAFQRPDRVASRLPAAAEPDHGILLAAVLLEGNAYRSGLRAGDVLLAYDAVKLARPADLSPAIQAAQQVRSGQGHTDRQNRGVGEEHAPASAVSLTVWRDGVTKEFNIPPGRMGVQPSQASMPAALRDWRRLQLTRDEQFVRLAAATTRGGFGELKPLPGTRHEVQALRKLAQRAGFRSDAIRILVGENATLTNLRAVTQSPRFLHFATHGLAETGPRFRESALALAVPENPNPDDFGFLRLQDLLEDWVGNSKERSWSC